MEKTLSLFSKKYEALAVLAEGYEMYRNGVMPVHEMKDYRTLNTYDCSCFDFTSENLKQNNQQAFLVIKVRIENFDRIFYNFTISVVSNDYADTYLNMMTRNKHIVVADFVNCGLDVYFIEWVDAIHDAYSRNAKRKRFGKETRNFWNETCLNLLEVHSLAGRLSHTRLSYFNDWWIDQTKRGKQIVESAKIVK